MLGADVHLSSNCPVVVSNMIITSLGCLRQFFFIEFTSKEKKHHLGGVSVASGVGVFDSEFLVDLCTTPWGPTYLVASESHGYSFRMLRGYSIEAILMVLIRSMFSEKKDGCLCIIQTVVCRGGVEETICFVPTLHRIWFK